MVKCGDCLHFEVCDPHTDLNESYPEVGGCPAFKRKDGFVEVSDKKLLRAIRLLIEQYKHSQNSEYVKHPVAHAMFKTWKKLDERIKDDA